MGRALHLMRWRLWVHDCTNWRLCNAWLLEIFAKSRETYCSINDRSNAWKTIQKHLCLGHKRSQMKQLLPKTWITFITITVRQSRMFIMQVWWRFYDSLCSECWISCFGYCCEYEWYMCFTFSDVFCFHALGGKWTSLVNMEVMQGICFFSCITKSPGVLDWKSNATLLATCVKLLRRS